MVKLHTELLGSDLSDVVAMHDFTVSTRISFRFVLRFSFYRGFWVYTFRLFRNWSLFLVNFSVSVFGDVFQRRFFSEKTFELRTPADETKDGEDSFQVDESMFVFRLEWFGMRVMIYVFSRTLCLVQQLIQQGQKRRSICSCYLKMFHINSARPEQIDHHLTCIETSGERIDWYPRKVCVQECENQAKGQSCHLGQSARQ